MLSLLFLFRVLIYSALVGEQQFQRKTHEGWLVDKARKLSQIIQPFSCCFSPHQFSLKHKQKSPRRTSLSIRTWNAKKVPQFLCGTRHRCRSRAVILWSVATRGSSVIASSKYNLKIVNSVHLFIYRCNIFIVHISKTLSIGLRVWLAGLRYLSRLFASQGNLASTEWTSKTAQTYCKKIWNWPIKENMRHRMLSIYSLTANELILFILQTNHWIANKGLPTFINKCCSIACLITCSPVIVNWAVGGKEKFGNSFPVASMELTPSRPICLETAFLSLNHWQRLLSR